MTRFFFLMLLVLFAASCKTKNVISIETLDKQRWDTLSKGISYISTKEDKGSNDSLIYKLVATMSTDGKIKSHTTSPEWDMNHAISVLIDQHPQNSSAGFVRINIDELMRTDTTRMNVYLSTSLNEPYKFSKDSALLVSIQGISAVKFISKADAGKKWLDDGNSDWEKILDDNPFPPMIEIDLDDRQWTATSLDSMKRIISANIKSVTDIQYPLSMSVTGTLYHYFEYKKK